MNIKNIIKLAVVFLPLLFIFGCQKLQQQDGWKTYEDKKLGYSITVPSDWEMKTLTTSSNIQVTEWRSQLDSETDKFQESLNMVVTEVGEEFASKEIKDIAKLTVNEYREYFEGFQLNDAQIVKFTNGIEAVFLDFYLKNKNARMAKYFFFKNGKEYIATAAAEPEKWEEYRLVFDKIVGSFRFI